MLCDLCQAAPATEHVTERSASGRFEDARYCRDCLAARLLSPVADFPRPRTTLRKVMLLVAAFAVPNAIAAWVMRSGFITGNPDQLRRWTRDAFLVANLFTGLIVAQQLTVSWLGRVRWHRRSGGIRPMPSRRGRNRGVPRKVIVVSAIAAIAIVVSWFVGTLLLARWLSPRIGMGRGDLDVLVVTMALFVLPAPVFLMTPYGRPQREQLQREWTKSSPKERFWKIIQAMWLLAFGLLCTRSWFHAWLASFGQTLALLVFVAIVFGSQAVILAGLAFATRRR